ncbi:MAG TPA: hypothetical protein VJ855_04730 [Marinilabiliaceae bacterium]|nr:hypothetical protein [Marinilabiliaceae bacterium]
MKIKSNFATFLVGLALLTIACDSEDNNNTNELINNEKIFHVAMAIGSGSSSQTYVQNLSDLSKGEISFSKFGFEVPSTRTARIYASEDGSALFNLDYGGGRIYKYKVVGNENYNRIEETNVQIAVGTAYPRWTKVNEDHALLHNIVTENLYDENDVYIRTSSTANLVSVELENLNMESVESFEVPYTKEDSANNNYVFRIDAPIVSNDKAFYGMAKRHYDPETDKTSTPEYTNVETLVVDYPSMTNPYLISTKVGGAKGSTNGYRTPVGHKDENGDIYQIISVPDNTYDTYILRIKDGEYDESYSFNLSELLGENTSSNGWFYVGNGIGYVPYANTDEGELADPVWSVARVDLYNSTAVKLNLPQNLWLQQYQYSVAHKGHFYMAIAPLGGEGFIYIFDIESAQPDAFTKGAKIQTGADAYYIGVF